MLPFLKDVFSMNPVLFSIQHPNCANIVTKSGYFLILSHAFATWRRAVNFLNITNGFGLEKFQRRTRRGGLCFEEFVHAADAVHAGGNEGAAKARATVK